MSCGNLVQYSNPSLFQKSSPNSQHDTTAPCSPAITNRPKKPTPTRSPYLMKVRRNAMGEKKFPDPTKAESTPDQGAAKRDSGFPLLESGYQPLELDRPILEVVRSCSSRPCCPAKSGGVPTKAPANLVWLCLSAWTWTDRASLLDASKLQWVTKRPGGML